MPEQQRPQQLGFSSSICGHLTAMAFARCALYLKIAWRSFGLRAILVEEIVEREGGVMSTTAQHDAVETFAACAETAPVNGIAVSFHCTTLSMILKSKRGAPGSTWT